MKFPMRLISLQSLQIGSSQKILKDQPKQSQTYFCYRYPLRYSTKEGMLRNVFRTQSNTYDEAFLRK